MHFKRQGKICGVSEMTWISVSRIVTVYIYTCTYVFVNHYELKVILTLNNTTNIWEITIFINH